MQPAASTLSSSSSIDFSIFFPPSDIFPIVSFATTSSISNSDDSFPLPWTRRSLPSSSLTRRCDRIWKSPRDSDLQVTRSFPTFSIFFSIFVYRELQRRVSANYNFYSSEQTDTDFRTDYASSFYLSNLTVAPTNRLKKPRRNVGRTDCRAFLCLWNEKRGIWRSRTSFSRAYPRGPWNRQDDDE